jgi:hypothetical protein
MISFYKTAITIINFIVTDLSLSASHNIQRGAMQNSRKSLVVSFSAAHLHSRLRIVYRSLTVAAL